MIAPHARSGEHAMLTILRQALLFLVVIAPAVGAQARRLELNDLGREVSLSAPRLSPDGMQAAVIVSRTNYNDNRFERSLYIVDVATGAAREVTPGRRNVGFVDWSPDGSRLAFVDGEGDRPAQLFVMPVAGGESKRVTDTKRAVVGMAWKPDGSTLAYLTEDDPVERTGDER